MTRALLVLMVTVSCASEYARRVPAADDPSNPAAPSARVEPVTLYEPAASPRQAAAPDAGTSTVYTCVMHPEVQLPGPGVCPKCGMKLVPKETR